jgi:hypothetical protein
MEECNCLQFGEMRLYATPEAAVEAGANNPRPDVAPENHLEITVRSVGMVDVFDGPKGGDVHAYTRGVMRSTICLCSNVRCV